MNLRSAWVAETGQTREDTRLTQLGATTPVNPLEVRSGILPGSYDGLYRMSGFWMEGAAGAMSATVHEGRAVIAAGATQGAYPVTLPEPSGLAFTDGDATNPVSTWSSCGSTTRSTTTPARRRPPWRSSRAPRRPPRSPR